VGSVDVAECGAKRVEHVSAQKPERGNEINSTKVADKFQRWLLMVAENHVAGTHINFTTSFPKKHTPTNKNSATNSNQNS
jgi:hypothetical protein